MGWVYRVCRTAARTLASAIWRLRGFGADRIPQKGGVLLASNHQSFLDPALIAACAPRPVSFMARSTLFRNGMFGALIRTLGTFPVKRGTADLHAVREAIDRLRAGAALLVFPEGTRTRDGALGPMKAGVRMLAQRAGVPVVPVLVEGAYRVWPRTRLWPGRGSVRVRFGEPFRVEGCSDEEVERKLKDAMASLKCR